MIDDTINLLKNCNAGIKTAVKSMEEVLDNIDNQALQRLILNNKKQHEELGNKVHIMLNEYNKDEEDPKMMADVMSWLKINLKLLKDSSDNQVADLMVDGCNMGIKSLYKYMNQYSDAEKRAIELTKETIKLENDLNKSLMQYL